MTSFGPAASPLDIAAQLKSDASLEQVREKTDHEEDSERDHDTHDRDGPQPSSDYDEGRKNRQSPDEQLSEDAGMLVTPGSWRRRRVSRCFLERSCLRVLPAHGVASVP